jgi:hypothetical protein
VITKKEALLGLKLERLTFRDLSRAVDAVKAFVEKRKPVFKNS